MTRTITAIIELDHLQKNFSKFTALKDVSFTLVPGQVLDFLGPNGTGGPATIRVILDLLRKSGGSVTAFDKDTWRGDAAIHPHIVYVPGDAYSWSDLSGGEIINLLLHLNGRRHNQKTDELTEAFEFDPKEKVRTYSEGNH